MQIDEELIKHVADVARLNLSENETRKFVPQLKEILEHFKKIEKMDVDGVEPSFHPIEIKDVLREDKEESSLAQEEALKNSEQKDGYFKGPGAI